VEINCQITQLQIQTHHLTESNTTLTTNLETERQKTQQLENLLQPLEKKLQEREQTLQQLTSQYTLDKEEKLAYLKKLEADCRAFKDEREFLLSKVQISEKMLTEKIDQLRKEGQELSENYQNQCKTIEKIMLQKRNLMFQLTNEVKRNGTLVKENSELRQTIQLQQHIIANMGIQSPASVQILETPDQLEITHQNGAASEVSPGTRYPEPSQPHIVIPAMNHMWPVEARTTLNNNPVVLRKPEYDHEDTITINSNSWISSVPILGKFLSPSKTFRKKFEVIV